MEASTYRNRHLEPLLREYAGFYSVVLVTGARQVGKSTLLAHAFPDIKCIVFEPIRDLYGARRDPELFLQSFPPPLILDEIQYAPELLPVIKRRADELGAPGLYLLTGSQNLAMLRTVAESLAGRVGVLHLEGMTLQEARGDGLAPVVLSRYLEAPDRIREAFAGIASAADGNVVRQLWRGSYPKLLDAADRLVPGFYHSYIQTYLERDVRVMSDIRDHGAFDLFLGLCGALTAQEVNLTKMSREIGVSLTTIRNWLDLVRGTYQWLELPPYQGNAVKRLIGKSKGLISDTGLACALQRITSPEALAVNPLRGALFETRVVNEFHRQASCLPVPPQFYHWRTAGGAEVDLVLEWNGNLYPIEMKLKTQIGKHDASGIRAFVETYGASGRARQGLIVYAGTECYSVTEHAVALPWNAVVR